MRSFSLSKNFGSKTLLKQSRSFPIVQEKKTFDTIRLFDYTIFTSSLEKIEINKKTIINTINQNAYVVAENDASFKKALLASDILLPDGVGIVAAAKVLLGLNAKKIAGADLHAYLIDQLNQQHKRCFYLGASQRSLDLIKENLKKQYPDLEAGFYSPAFTNEFSVVESKEMIDAVNAFNPDVLFIGMTAPKQEKWVHTHKEELHANVICSIGAVFDFYAGTVKRPGKFWIKLGLEWFARLIREPKRMWRRYLYNGPIFLYILFKRRIFGLS